MQITIDQETFHKLAVAAGYVRLGDVAAAMEALETRVTEGFRRIREARIAGIEETRQQTAQQNIQQANAFLQEVSELEQREDLKPAEKPTTPVRRKQVEAAFRAMIDKYSPGHGALEAGREVLKQVGATNVPAIPEAKLAACLALLNISDHYPTAEGFIERLKSHDGATG